MQSISLGIRLQPTSKENLMASTKRTLHPLPCQSPQLATPLPKLTWASSLELWRHMRAKDRVKIAPESDLRQRHPSIMASMRTILLDWMMEVGINATRERACNCREVCARCAGPYVLPGHCPRHYLPLVFPFLARCRRNTGFTERRTIWPWTCAIDLWTLRLTCRKNSCS